MTRLLPRRLAVVFYRSSTYRTLWRFVAVVLYVLGLALFFGSFVGSGQPPEKAAYNRDSSRGLEFTIERERKPAGKDGQKPDGDQDKVTATVSYGDTALLEGSATVDELKENIRRVPPEVKAMLKRAYQESRAGK